MGHLSKAKWFAPIRRGYNAFRRLLIINRTIKTGPSPEAGRKPKVLALGIYLANRANTVEHLVQRFREAKRYDVTQVWTALNGAPPNPDVAAVTTQRLDGFFPKFCILNRQLEGLDWRAFDYLVLVDDDIVVPAGFVDAFLDLQREFDFALAQPARTRNSFADRKFCRQSKGIRGRRTRFVEIGPLFSVRRDFAPSIIPFDETSGMGWGYDFVWPVLAEAAGLRIGIIDATPVDHSLRDQASAYSSAEAGRAMATYFDGKKHLSKHEAFSVLETF